MTPLLHVCWLFLPLTCWCDLLLLCSQLLFQLLPARKHHRHHPGRLCLNALQLEHAFGGRAVFAEVMLKHYKFAFLSQVSCCCRCCGGVVFVIVCCLWFLFYVWREHAAFA